MIEITDTDAPRGNAQVGVLASPTFSPGQAIEDPYWKNMTGLSTIAAWIPNLSGSAEITRGREASVKAARKVERTNEHIRGGLDRKANMVVGTDIRLQSQVDWRALGLEDNEQTRTWAAAFNRRRETLFRQWGSSSRCLNDGEGHYGFGGQMWLAARNLYGPDAESAGVIHYDQPRADAYGTKWATYVTVVDPSRISTPPLKAGEKTVFHGRQLDRDGRWTGFWLQNGYPGETSSDDSEFVLVPRENLMGRPMAWHWFMKSRGAAQRGMTSMVTIIKAALHLDKFDDAQLQSAIIEAAMALTLRTSKTAETAREMLNTAPTSGSVLSGGMTFAERGAFYKASGGVKISPNQVTILAPDDELVMETVSRAAQDFTSFRENILRPMASSLNMPTEIITKDYTQSTYSSIRASIVDSYRDILAERGLFTDHVPMLVADAVTEEMVAKGWLDLWPGHTIADFYENRDAYTACDFIGPGMGWVDPLKEALAAGARVGLGISSLQREIRMSSGGDFEDIIEERRAELQLADKYEVPLGIAQQVAGSIGVDVQTEANQNSETVSGPTPRKLPKPTPPPGA